MKERIVPNKPILLMLYGFPGAGKTYFARQFCEAVQAAHLEQDRVRKELFERPTFSKQENAALNRIMEFMTGEFLGAGISVVLDMNAMRTAQRHALRELARNAKATPLLVWFQVDADTAFIRNQKRDRRKADDRYAVGYDVDPFKQLAAYMQHPMPTEDYVVVSGKHHFAGQLSSVAKKLADLRIISASAASHRMIKPELVNLVPHQQEANGHGHTRRNIILR